MVGLRLRLCVSVDTAPLSSHPSVRWRHSRRCLRSGSRGDGESPVSFICTRLFITRVLPPLEVRCACFAFWGVCGVLVGVVGFPGVFVRLRQRPPPAKTASDARHQRRRRRNDSTRKPTVVPGIFTYAPHNNHGTAVVRAAATCSCGCGQWPLDGAVVCFLLLTSPATASYLANNANRRVIPAQLYRGGTSENNHFLGYFAHFGRAWP